MENKKAKVKDLKPGFYLYGNKGTVWQDTAHIAQTGHATTLCGTPMLATNWARREKVKEIGCELCNRHYAISNIVDEYIEEIFSDAHYEFNTKSGDIFPDQQITLDRIKDDLTQLVMNQVSQNI
jgi:hypothetical protein